MSGLLLGRGMDRGGGLTSRSDFKYFDSLFSPFFFLDRVGISGSTDASQVIFRLGTLPKRVGWAITDPKVTCYDNSVFGVPRAKTKRSQTIRAGDKEIRAGTLTS